MGWGWWCQIALLLCAHSADARQQQPTVSLTNAASVPKAVGCPAGRRTCCRWWPSEVVPSGMAFAPWLQVASLEVEAAPRFITLHNIRRGSGVCNRVVSGHHRCAPSAAAPRHLPRTSWPAHLLVQARRRPYCRVLP
jgi:hypothetical protein